MTAWAAALVVVGLAAFFGRREALRVGAAWSRAAAELGLVHMRGTPRTLRVLCGQLSGFEVRVEADGGGVNARTYTRVTVSAEKLRAGLVVHRLLPSKRQRPGPQSVATGDPEFDCDFEVLGPDATVLALMSSETRRELLRTAPPAEFAGGRVSDALTPPVLQSGQLTLQVPEHVASADTLIAMVKLEVRLAEALAEAPACVPARLAGHVSTEVLPEVRLRNLVALLASAPDSPEARQTLHAALADRDAAIRLTAARASGALGVPVLRELLFSREASSLRVAALRPLLDVLPAEELDPVLAAALDDDDERLVLAAVAAIGEHARQTLAPHVRALVARCPLEARTAEIAAAAIEVLMSLRTKDIERELIRLLDHPDRRVLESAAAALGIVGTSASVERLQALSKPTHGDAEVRRAARLAVLGIQARTQAAGPGGLSLVEVPSGSGEVSVVEEVGALSTVEEVGALSTVEEVGALSTVEEVGALSQVEEPGAAAPKTPNRSG